MNRNFTHQEKQLQFNRYPPTNNRSLQAWNAADDYLLQRIENMNLEKNPIAIFNDRFGFLSCCLHSYSPIVVLNYKSQEKAIQKNLEFNKLESRDFNWINPLEEFPKKIKIGIIKIPKSTELFRLQLLHLHTALEEDGQVFCGFMSKYFTRKMLTIAREFFENVEQSKAWKKSRVIVLQKKKTVQSFPVIHSIPFREKVYQQYFGVFSAKNIDFASQFFIEHLAIKKEEKRILDLASGNGVLAKTIQLQKPNCELHLMDDSFLAVESSKLNLDLENTFFHYSDSMEIFKDAFFDVVVSNPPFHFEYETNIEVAIKLFQNVKRCMKSDGRFLLVANQHLNYKTHLSKIFNTVNLTAKNSKFEIYECS